MKTSPLPIYLDNCASTRVDPRALAEMLPFFDVHFGNAGSRSHAYGWTAEEAVEKARGQVASLIGARSSEITFTSGATESNNLAIKAVAAAARARGNHIIVGATEHKSVLDCCQRLSKEGFVISILPVDRWGMVDVEQLKSTITPRTILVSLMMANNEIGTLHPIHEIAKVCADHNVLLHTDATQAVGKMPIDVRRMPVDLMSFTAHKMYGPKGVGALYVRRRTPALRLLPLIDGGGQQNGLRSGTLPVPLVVGFGAAAALAAKELPEEMMRLARLRDRLESGIRQSLPGVKLNGHPEQRTRNVTNLSFPNIDSEVLLASLTEVAASSSAACTADSAEPSHVLMALGVTRDLAHSTLRLSVGRFTTEEEIDLAIAAIIRAVKLAAKEIISTRSSRQVEALSCVA